MSEEVRLPLLAVQRFTEKCNKQTPSYFTVCGFPFSGTHSEGSATLHKLRLDLAVFCAASYFLYVFCFLQSLFSPSDDAELLSGEGTHSRGAELATILELTGPLHKVGPPDRHAALLPSPGGRDTVLSSLVWVLFPARQTLSRTVVRSVKTYIEQIVVSQYNVMEKPSYASHWATLQG